MIPPSCTSARLRPARVSRDKTTDDPHAEFLYSQILRQAGNDEGADAALASAYAVVDKIVDTYLELREDGEAFIDTYRRLGQEPFKERVYGTA